MPKGLLRHQINFEILPTSNNKIIVFLDTSEYFENPETPILKITPPGSSRFFQVNIEDGRINVLTSNSIGLTEILESDCQVDFLDGVWKFTYMICPYKYIQITKYILRTNIIDHNIKEIYKSIDIADECSDNTCIKKDLINIHLLLESAKANCDLNNIDKGIKDFKLAQAKVKEVTNIITRR